MSKLKSLTPNLWQQKKQVTRNYYQHGALQALLGNNIGKKGWPKACDSVGDIVQIHDEKSYIFFVEQD